MTEGSAIRVLVILPAEDIPKQTIDRIEQLLSRYFPTPTNVLTIAVFGDKEASFIGAFNDCVRVYESGMISTNEVIVISDELIGKIEIPENKRQYSLEHYRWRVLLHLRNQAIDERDWPAVNAHAFNRVGPRLGWDCHEYFPYGLIYRECAVGGPIDAFGFRICGDLADYRRRSETHKLIVILGGSAAWSWFTPYEESFPQVLERRLQRHVEERKSGEHLTVLNFGQGGSVLLHEMIVWMLHVEGLRPEIVITHDGYNDLLFGMTTDPFLIRRDICAPHIFELWGRKLHDRDEVAPRFQHGEPVSVVNFPRQITQAFLARKLQLDGWIRAAGGQHIAALQPYARSKTLAADEVEQLERQRYRWIWGEAQGHIPELYEQVSSRLASTDLSFFNLHEYFKRFGADEVLFQDFMHTTPAGDARIAEAYSEYIIRNSLI